MGGFLMVKPTDSKSLHRPLKKDSEGRKLNLPATIVSAGHVSSVVRIGPVDFRIGNAALRDAAGDPTL
jgi:hypothetical protein